MRNKSPKSMNFVRIVYLKEMGQQPKNTSNDQSSFTRNSLAYLSSLIQQDNKKRMDNQIRSSVDWSSQPMITQIKQIRRINKNTAPVKQFRDDNNPEPRRLSLNKLLHQIKDNRMPSIDIKQKMKTIKLQQKDLLNRQKQLFNSYMTFCNQIKSKNSIEQNQRSISFQKQSERVIYVNNKISQQKPNKIKLKLVNSNSESKNPKLFRRRSIAYRRNFKEINNFEWGKIAEQGYDFTQIKNM